MPNSPSDSTDVSPLELAADVAAVGRIGAIQKILEVICRMTGMGFSAVARVTDAKWVACAVRDEIAFGLVPGGELELRTTICNEIRQSGQLVIIDNVATDPNFCGHPTPAKYGFQSYVSVPIVLPDGRFFGTLCAIDPRPAKVNTPETIGMFKLFADLVGLHLDAAQRTADERAANNAAAERLDRLRSVIESAKDYAVISIDAAGTIDGWSTGATDTFGWSEKQTIGQSFDLIWTGEDRAAGVPSRELKTANDKGMCPDNRWHVRSDGRRVYVTGSTRPVRNAAGELRGYVKVCRDETIAQATEQALVDARRRLDAALAGGRVATWVWEVGADRLHGDRNMFILFNLPDDQGGGLPVATYAGTLHPDDRQAVMAALDRSVRTGEDYEAEYRVVTTEPPRWLYARASVERGTGGRPVRLAGMVIDVTDRKAAEAEVRASAAESRFLADLGEATRQVGDPDAVLAVTVERLRQQLGVPRCAYAEVDEDQDGIEVRYDAATAGMSSVAGRFRLANFGPPMLAELRAGRTAAVADVTTDPRTVEGGAAMAAVGVAAVVNVPLVKDGRLVAVLAVHESRPREWSAAEVRLIEAVAERSWAEVERARSARALARSEARQSYLVRLSDGIRTLSDPADVQAVASRLLAEQLGVVRVAYFEIIGADYVVERDHSVGVWSLVGRNPVAAFGQTIVDRLMAGRTVIEPDAIATLTRSEAERATFADWHIGALVTVPLIKGKAFVAGLTVHAAQPRKWTAPEVALIEDTAERTWSAVERARAMRAVEESERRRRLAAEAADVGSFNIDPTTSTMETDAQFRRLFTGSDEPITYEQAFARIHPDDREMVRDRVAAAIDPADGQTYEAEYRVIHPDGTVVWIAARGRCVFDGEGTSRRAISFDGTVTDVTDRKRVDAELAFQRYRLELIFQISPAAMALWVGDDLVFEHVNPGYQNLFHGRLLVGRPLLDALPELRGQGFDALIRQVLRTGEPFVGREMLVRLARTADGPVEDSYFDFSYIQVLDPGGNPWGVYNHAVDVTDRVLARQALEASQAQLQQALADREHLLESERAARSEAELAGRMKDEFLATLSHELRTPLNAILGWSQIISAGGNGPEDVAEGMEVIQRNARAQSQIIEDLLDMSRIMSGKVRLDVQRVDLAGVAQASVASIRPTAEAKGVRLQSVIDPLHDVVVTGDVNRLQQVLWNLLTNAVKFTPKGGRVQLLLERVNSHLEISVIDTGEGISPQFLPHVFDRFRQADATTTRRHGGLGLGLSIVKQLVELHGGSVRVKSAGLGHGATFVVALPLTIVKPHSEPEPDRRHPTAAPALRGLDEVCVEVRGVRVLVIDDEPDARALMKRLLEDCHAVVTATGSSDEVVRLVETKQFDVLVSDIGMPGEDGYTLIRRIRALGTGHGGDIPAIALTAYARAEDRVKAIAAGFMMHVAKPVEPVELVTMVAGAAGRTWRPG